MNKLFYSLISDESFWADRLLSDFNLNNPDPFQTYQFTYQKMISLGPIIRYSHSKGIYIHPNYPDKIYFTRVVNCGGQALYLGSDKHVYHLTDSMKVKTQVLTFGEPEPIEYYKSGPMSQVSGLSQVVQITQTHALDICGKLYSLKRDGDEIKGALIQQSPITYLTDEYFLTSDNQILDVKFNPAPLTSGLDQIPKLTQIDNYHQFGIDVDGYVWNIQAKGRCSKITNAKQILTLYVFKQDRPSNREFKTFAIDTNGNLYVEEGQQFSQVSFPFNIGKIIKIYHYGKESTIRLFLINEFGVLYSGSVVDDQYLFPTTHHRLRVRDIDLKCDQNISLAVIGKITKKLDKGERREEMEEREGGEIIHRDLIGNELIKHRNGEYSWRIEIDGEIYPSVSFSRWSTQPNELDPIMTKSLTHDVEVAFYLTNCKLSAGIYHRATIQ